MTYFDKILSTAFYQQRLFMADKSRRKCLFVARRGAKTFAIAIYILLAAISNPKVKILYLGLSKESAENALWRDCLQTIFDNAGMKEGTHYTYNRVNKTVEFRNKSTIRMTGADTSFKEPGKLLGGKYFMAVIDECQNYTQNLESIILSVLGPAVSDYINDGGGQIILAGTAGPYMGKHYWYRINTEKELGWSIHTWDGKDNPHMKVQKEVEEHDFLQQYGPDYVKTDWYQQQYLCHWVFATTALIYKFERGCNISSPECIDSLSGKRIERPSEAFLASATYILALDIGYNDPSAFVVVAYNLKYSNKLFVIESFVQDKLLPREIAAKIKALDSRYRFTYMVGDSSNLTVFETLCQDYSFPIEKANRTGKLSHQFVLNGDFVCKNIVFMPGNEALTDQLQTVVWDRTALVDGRYVEDPAYKNDLTDALLYAHNYSRHLWFRPPPKQETEQEHFVSSILEGERALNRIDMLKADKRRLNPYQHKPVYR